MQGGTLRAPSCNHSRDGTITPATPMRASKLRITLVFHTETTKTTVRRTVVFNSAKVRFKGSDSNRLLSDFDLLRGCRNFGAELHGLMMSFTAASAQCNCNDNSGDNDSALHSLLSYAVPGLAEPNQHKFN